MHQEGKLVIIRVPNRIAFPKWVIILLVAALPACQVSPSGTSLTAASQPPTITLPPTATSLPQTLTSRPTSTPRPTAPPTSVRATYPPTADPEVSNWLRIHAWPLDKIEPIDEDDFSDLTPLKDFIGKARIVALGEGTHGTHEFFTMKHRLVRFLVQEMGFNTFAIEASWPVAIRVNDYVLRGEGDPATALAGIYFPWNTQEVLDMIEWMRRHNQDPGGSPVVSFHGFDAQVPTVAVSNVVDYFQRVDLNYAAEARDKYDCLLGDIAQYTGLPKVKRDACRADLQSVMDRLKTNRQRYMDSSSPETYTLAEQNARIVLQVEDVLTDPRRSVRDRYLAENVRWLLDQAGPDAKIILWAHNAHVADAAQGSHASMGRHLRDMYAQDMIIFGFSFNDGQINAYGYPLERQTANGSLGAYPVPPALPKITFEWYAHSAGLPAFILNLRDLRIDQSTTWWLTQPLLLRSIGATYDQTLSPGFYLYEYNLPEAFDAIIYIDRSTPTQLLPLEY